jgi:hypothetical protein
VVAEFGDGYSMRQKFSLAIAIAVAALLGLPAIAFAGSVHGKRHVIYRWRGYGFLPGYHQPEQGVRYDAPSYRYGGGRYYYGEPGFARGRWNGGSFGPCWTSTPIGLIWNCG